MSSSEGTSTCILSTITLDSQVALGEPLTLETPTSAQSPQIVWCSLWPLLPVAPAATDSEVGMWGRVDEHNDTEISNHHSIAQLPLTKRCTLGEHSYVCQAALCTYSSQLLRRRHNLSVEVLFTK